MNYIYDVSFVTALIAPDENDPKIDKIHKEVGEDEFIYLPHLFWYEIANIFMNMIRRKRYVYEQFSHFFNLLKAFRLTTDYEAGADYSQNLLRLSNTYNLSSYDAAYLELAERKKAVLCTLDEGLINAAKKHGVEVINVI